MPSHLTLADLAAGDEIELNVIASNEGWDWLSATVLTTDPFCVRWWDGTEQSWARPGARIPLIRRKPDPEPGDERAPEFEITFTLAAGFDEQDAIELYEYIERHKAVDGAALSGRFMGVEVKRGF
jgi:hypothetical protein